MPYAYQCCAFGVCENVYKISNQWNKGDNSTTDDLHKKDAGMFQVQGKTNCPGDEIVSGRVLKSHQTDHLTSRHFPGDPCWESMPPFKDSQGERKLLVHSF